MFWAIRSAWCRIIPSHWIQGFHDFSKGFQDWNRTRPFNKRTRLAEHWAGETSTCPTSMRGLGNAALDPMTYGENGENDDDKLYHTDLDPLRTTSQLST